MCFTKEWIKEVKEAEKEELCHFCEINKATRIVYNPNGIPFSQCEECRPHWDIADKPLNKVFHDIRGDF